VAAVADDYDDDGRDAARPAADGISGRAGNALSECHVYRRRRLPRRRRTTSEGGSRCSRESAQHLSIAADAYDHPSSAQYGSRSEHPLDLIAAAGNDVCGVCSDVAFCFRLQ